MIIWRPSGQHFHDSTFYQMMNYWRYYHRLRTLLLYNLTLENALKILPEYVCVCVCMCVCLYVCSAMYILMYVCKYFHLRTSCVCVCGFYVYTTYDVIIVCVCLTMFLQSKDPSYIYVCSCNRICTYVYFYLVCLVEI